MLFTIICKLLAHLFHGIIWIKLVFLLWAASGVDASWWYVGKQYFFMSKALLSCMTHWLFMNSKHLSSNFWEKNFISWRILRFTVNEVFFPLRNNEWMRKITSAWYTVYFSTFIKLELLDPQNFVWFYLAGPTYLFV